MFSGFPAPHPGIVLPLKCFRFVNLILILLLYQQSLTHKHTLYCIRLDNFCDLQDLELRQCYDGVCLPSKPKIVFGTKGSSSDSYIKNKAYGDFLHKAFNVSTADQESAAVAWVSKKE